MASRILLADDSITIQKVVNLTFADEGIEVVTVSNGEMAQRRLAEINPDLVLADIFMPGKNGYELCQYIKESPQFRTVPVVLLVGAFEPFDQAEARRVSADGHLTKPFESRTLVETVRKLIQERKSNSGQLRSIQQAQGAGSAPETRPLTTQPLETPFNIDLSPLEEASLSSDTAYGTADSIVRHEPDDALSHLSSLGEPLKLDYGVAWHPEPGPDANGANGQQPPAGNNDRATADLAPVLDPSNTLGFDFTEVDQPEPPLPADTFSVDLLTTDHSSQPSSGLPDFAASVKAEDDLLNMELSHVRVTEPLEAPAIERDDAAGPAAANMPHIDDFEPAAPSATASAMVQGPSAQSFVGEEEPLGDVLSDEPGPESVSVSAPPGMHAHEPSVWSAPAVPADDNITLDFSSLQGDDHLADSTEVSSQADQVPLSNLGPGDFLIGSDEIKGTGAANLRIVDVISPAHEEDATALPFQPLSLETGATSEQPALLESPITDDADESLHEGPAFTNVSDFRASEMWALEEAQFSPIDIEAVPVAEGQNEAEVLAEGVEDVLQVPQPTELTSTPHVSQPIELTSTPHVSQPTELTSTPHVSQPIELTSTTVESTETSFEFAVPAPDEAVPEIGFDIVQSTPDAVVTQPDFSRSAEASQSAAARSPLPPEVGQEAKVADDGRSANLSMPAVDEIVRRVLQEMSDSVVREIAWEIVPDCVERVVAATVERLARDSLAKKG